MTTRSGVVAIDMGATYTRVARFEPGESLRPGFHEVRQTPRTQAEQLDLLVALADKTRDRETRAIGVALAAPVRPTDSYVLRGGILELGDIDLSSRLSQALGLPVLIANDARAAAQAEGAFGAASDVDVAVMLTIGSGIGGGITDHGELVLRTGLAGEFGHLPIFETAGPCGCGAAGCWELRASGSSLRRRLGGQKVSGYDDATPAQRVVLEQWAGDLRAGLWAIQLGVDPDLFVMGGGVGRLAVAMLRHFTIGTTRTIGKLSPVAEAAFGDEAGLKGVAELARRRIA